MFNGKSFNEKFLLTRKQYDFACAINCTRKLTCMCACACACNCMRLKEQYENTIKRLMFWYGYVWNIVQIYKSEHVKRKECMFSHFLLHINKYATELLIWKIFFVPQPWWGAFTTTQLKKFCDTFSFINSNPERGLCASCSMHGWYMQVWVVH